MHSISWAANLLYVAHWLSEREPAKWVGSAGPQLSALKGDLTQLEQ